ncbi:MAG: hypothetical protein AABX54_04590 [Nanoarchaeota archaeon]
MVKRSDNLNIKFIYNENNPYFQMFTLRGKVSHNKKLFWIIIILIIFFIGLIYFLAKNSKNSDNNITKECEVDNDCVAATCCHADKCVTLDKKPDCKGMFCTMDCSGPLDCGAGHCGCVNGKCAVVSNTGIK